MSRGYSDTDDYSDHGLNPEFHIVPSSSQYNQGSRHSQDQYEQEEQTELLKQYNNEELKTEGEEKEEAELPPIEWHPAVVFIAKVIKTLFSPIFKILFAPKAQRAMVKSFIIVIVVAWILLTSFTAYLTFYQRYIPKNAHVEPIYFQYGHLEQQPEGRLEFTGPDPYSTMLRHEQAYDVSIHLHVPTSDINFNLGNFMVTVELETKNGTVLAQSSRPAILRYQSNTQRILHVLAKALPLLIGWTEESQTIHVHLIENFIENQVTPLTQARVTLSTSKLQVYDAHLSLVADFRGLRYYMYHKRITTAVIFIVLFTVIEVVCAMAAWKAFGKNLWDKLHEAFSTDEITAEEEQNQESITTVDEPTTYHTEEEDGYLTED